MTRQEQIINASQLYAKPLQKPFIDGAFWADKHPVNYKPKWSKEDIYTIDCLIDYLENELTISSNKRREDFAREIKLLETIKKKMEE